MAYAEYRAAEAALSDRQRAWLGHKAQWEKMSRFAVLCDWTPPPDGKLNEDGTWRT